MAEKRIDEKILEEVRRRLENVCPMSWDCGKKCAAACCQPDEDGQGGMYLFPGEEEMVEGSWGEIVPSVMGTRKVNMFVCSAPCDRSRRPIGCMIFPLTPTVDEEGKVKVRFDYRARRMCPLLKYGVRGLNAQFVKDVRDSLRLIASDEVGMEFLRDWQALEEQYDFHL